MAVALAHTVLKMRSLSAAASGSMATTPTPGNLIVVVANFYYSGTINVSSATASDNQGNTYTHITAADGSRTATGQASAVFYAKNVSATGTFTVTADGKTGNTATTAFVYEVSAASTTAPHTTGEEGGGNGSLSPMAAASHATATADCFVVGTGGINAANASNTFTPDATLGWGTGAEELDGANWYASNSAYKVLSATSTQQYKCGFTLNSGSSDYAASWAAFVGAGGGGGTTFTQSVAGTLTSSGATTKKPGKSLAGTLTSAGALAKRTTKAFAGTLTSAATLAPVKVAIRAFAGTLSTAGSLALRPGKALAGTLTSSGALSRRTNKPLAGTLTTSGAPSSLRAVLRTFTGTLTTAGTLTRSVGKTVSGSLSAGFGTSGSLTKLVTKVFVGTLGLAGTGSGQKVVDFVPSVAGGAAKLVLLLLRRPRS